MKLRATIYVDLEVEDFKEAAQKQIELERYVQELDHTYDTASMEMKERRDRETKRAVKRTTIAPKSSTSRAQQGKNAGKDNKKAEPKPAADKPEENSKPKAETAAA